MCSIKARPIYTKKKERGNISNVQCFVGLVQTFKEIIFRNTTEQNSFFWWGGEANLNFVHFKRTRMFFLRLLDNFFLNIIYRQNL